MAPWPKNVPRAVWEDVRGAEEVPRKAKEDPREPPDGPRCPQESPQEAPIVPNTAKHRIHKYRVFHIRKESEMVWHIGDESRQSNKDYKTSNNQNYLKAWEAHGGPRQPQDDPRKAQPGPKRVQEGPRCNPRKTKMAPIWTIQDERLINHQPMNPLLK